MEPLADRMERLITREVGRNIGPLAAAARGGLGRAAAALAEARSAVIMTGFYIPKAEPPAAETDGPIGAVLLARALVERGVPVRLATDAPCAPVVQAALGAADWADVCPLDIVAVEGFAGGEPLETVEARLRGFAPSHIVAIERCGPAADGRPRNARGEDVGAYTAPLERLFALQATTIGIGDGGNELGMGSLPLEVIAGAIAHGEVSACRTPADVLVVAGVSNWAGIALALLLGLDVDGVLHDRLLAAVTEAGAVDGITRMAGGTVDGVPAEAHHALVAELNVLARGEQPA